MKPIRQKHVGKRKSRDLLTEALYYPAGHPRELIAATWIVPGKNKPVTWVIRRYLVLSHNRNIQRHYPKARLNSIVRIKRVAS